MDVLKNMNSKNINRGTTSTNKALAAFPRSRRSNEYVTAMELQKTIIPLSKLMKQLIDVKMSAAKTISVK